MSEEIKLDLDQIEDISFVNVDKKDHPDYSDACIVSATYQNRYLTEEELDWLHENAADWVDEQLRKYLEQ